MSEVSNSNNSWMSKNQQYLLACMEQVKSYLRALPSSEAKPQPAPLWEGGQQQPPALNRLCGIFGLTYFERMILLLCAAEELDSEVSKLCAQMHGNPSAAYPSFSIALAAFPDPYWSALSPTAPLRLFRLVSPLGLPQVPLTSCQLRIEERILHYLTGISYLERSMQGIVEPVHNDAPIVESQ